MKFESDNLESFLSRNQDLQLSDTFAEKVLSQIEAGDSMEQKEAGDLPTKNLWAIALIILLNGAILGFSAFASTDEEQTTGLEAFEKTYFESQSIYGQ